MLHIQDKLKGYMYLQSKSLGLWLSYKFRPQEYVYFKKKPSPYGLPMTAMRCKVLFISAINLHVLPDLMFYLLEYHTKLSTHLKAPSACSPRTLIGNFWAYPSSSIYA